MSVWDRVVGQVAVPDMRAAAVDAAEVPPGPRMTHAWLFTGPPGSGRSVMARAFAAALLCPDNGCDSCTVCRSVHAGSHPDMTVVTTEGLSLGVDRMRSVVRAAAMRPMSGDWQVILVEDADRLTDEAADALLLSVEEPPARTVWLLCVPTAEELAPTIRSRCRLVALRTPPAADVAALLVREGVSAETAGVAARASMGHIGRARGLARDDGSWERRSEVVRLPQRLDDLRSALDAAASLVAAAEDDASAHCDALDAQEEEALRLAASASQGRRAARVDRAALAELEKEQKRRRTRVRRDSLDRALVDVLAYYRDVLLLQVLGERAEPRVVNVELLPALWRLAAATDSGATLACIDAISEAREGLHANASPLLALEALAVTLARQGRAA